MISNAFDTAFDVSKVCFTTLGTYIHDLRERNNLSPHLVCQGLCSETTLLRIEKNEIKPSTLLAGALLNRLGVSEEGLISYGDSEEQEFLRLKYALLHKETYSATDYERKLTRLHELCSRSTSPYLKQTYLLFQLKPLPPSAQKQAQVFAALRLTLRDFDIDKMDQYCLTLNEQILCSYLDMHITS
ncbi:hypothetical protein SAMN02910358_02225 [Lachnospiraceae bacterium XBB1006]|nr:hypothetical protein SAMN02910358_02225 [Lachnospiraceae bacterium XBB1006]